MGDGLRNDLLSLLTLACTDLSEEELLVVCCFIGALTCSAVSSEVAGVKTPENLGSRHGAGNNLTSEPGSSESS